MSYTNDGGGGDNLDYENRLRVTGLTTLETRIVRADMIEMYITL